MRGLTLNVAIATVVFFAISFVWNSDRSIASTLFATLVFSLTYAAIQVAMIIFKEK